MGPYLPNELRMGAGGSPCLIACQIKAFNSWSSARSGWEKSSRDDSLAPGAVLALTSVIETLGAISEYGFRSGVRLNPPNMSGAEASKYVIGGMPVMCSIVRRMLVWLYMVESTTPRCVYGEMTQAGARCE